MDVNNVPKVLVLLATHNGEKYIEQQLESIFNQEGVKIDVLVSDDNSNDRTIEILECFSKNYNITILRGKFGSAQKNFFNLINKAQDYDYYAFADQDDYWSKDKILRGVRRLVCNYKPELYYSVSIPVDEELIPLNKKKYNHHAVVEFEKSIVATNSQGSTMVFNNCLMQYIKNKTTSTNLMHDSWIHKTCLLLGGNVYFEDKECMLYRQHQHNVIATLGKEKNTFDKIKRKTEWLFSSDMNYVTTTLCKEWLENYSNIIDEKKLAIINKILSSNTIKGKMQLLLYGKIYSKYIMDNIKYIRLLLTNKL